MSSKKQDQEWYLCQLNRDTKVHNLGQAAYGRKKEARVVSGKCDYCNSYNLKTLQMDHSDGEYGYIRLCLDSINKYSK